MVWWMQLYELFNQPRLLPERDIYHHSSANYDPPRKHHLPPVRRGGPPGDQCHGQAWRLPPHSSGFLWSPDLLRSASSVVIVKQCSRGEHTENCNAEMRRHFIVNLTELYYMFKEICENIYKFVTQKEQFSS